MGCGDGVIQSGEDCDDHNTDNLDGCNGACKIESGWTCPNEGQPCIETCGDGLVVGQEACDDQNDVDDDYCSDDCRTRRSCGDGARQTSAGEDCDDGNAITEICAYGLMSCSVCDASCHLTSGATSYCGDGAMDTGHEQCDDGNASSEACTYGQKSCTMCDMSCQLAAGATSYCGDGSTDAGHEQCDDGNTVTETCAYGQTSCTVCNGSCQSAPGATSYCGDGSTDTGHGEQCDDGNDTTETCAYGQTSCNVCDATCKSVPGATSYCGDGIKDIGNGEECDTAGASETCTAGCKLQKYCILDYTLVGSYRVTNAIAGNTTYPQTGGELRIRVPDSGGTPASGAAATLYFKMPTKFTTTVFVGTTLQTSVATDVMTTAGTPTNTCPLNTGTFSGTAITSPACPYGGGHCTTNWTPDDQNPPTITPTAGCLPVGASGTITCTGALCAAAGLKSGANNVNDSWYQPVTTTTLNAGLTTTHNGKTGDTSMCPLTGTTDNDYYEVPERATARGWVQTDGTRVSITCGQLPATNCP